MTKTKTEDFTGYEERGFNELSTPASHSPVYQPSLTILSACALVSRSQIGELEKVGKCSVRQANQDRDAVLQGADSV